MPLESDFDPCIISPCISEVSPGLNENEIWKLIQKILWLEARRAIVNQDHFMVRVPKAID